MGFSINGGGSGNGGAVVLPFPFVAPTSPSQWDDEFATTVLNAKWTSILSNTPTWDIHTSIPSCVALKCNGNTGISLTQAFVPGAATAFSITAGFSASLQSGQQNFNITLLTAADAAIIRHVFFANGSAAPTHYCDYDVAQTVLYQTAYGITFTGSFYLHLQRDASNNYEMFWSPDCRSWRYLGTVSKATAVGKLQILMSNNGATTKAIHSLDFVRVNWFRIPF